MGRIESQNEIKSITNEWKYLVAINILFFIYSFTGVLTKLAAQEEFLSIRFIFFYGGVLGIMGLYAIVWQQIIKKLSLGVAYANKASILFWGLLWAIIFFGEEVTIGKVAGIVIVMSGVILYATGNNRV